MTDLLPHQPGYDFDNDPAPARKVNDTALDAEHDRLFARDNAILAILDGFFRSDNTPIDEHTKLRHLSAEVRQAIASAGGWAVKAPCALATTGNITLSGEQVIDGTLTATTRVLVHHQTDAEDDGIYVTSAGAWTRATDADSAADLEAAYVYISGGATQAGTYWLQTATDITLETTELVWLQAGGSLDLASLPILTSGSTTPRSLADRFADVVNVLDHGAVADGVTDCTDAFTAAIATAPDGSAVYAPPGIYAMTGLTIAKAITIIGAGAATILRQTVTNDDLIDATGFAIEVRDLTIQGTFTTGSTHYAIKAGAGSRVQRVTFTGSDGTKGIDSAILAAANTVVDDCIFAQGFTAGVRVLDVSGVQISRSRFTADATFTWGGLDADATAADITTLSVTGCQFLGSGLTVDVASGRAMTLDISGCRVLNNGAVYPTISLNPTESTAFTGQFANNICVGYQALVIHGRLAVTGCLLLNGRTHGITLGLTPQNFLSGTAILGAGQAASNTYDGIFGTPTGGRVVMTGCWVNSATMRYAVNVTGVGFIEDTGSVINSGLTGRYNTTNQASVANTYVRKVTVGHAFFAAAATTSDVALLTLPAGHKVRAVTIKHATAFSGGGLTTYTISLGITGNLTKYAGAFNVFQAPGATVFQDSNTQGVESFTAPVSLVARATGSGNTNLATAGDVTFYVEITDLGAA